MKHHDSITQAGRLVAAMVAAWMLSPTALTAGDYQPPDLMNFQGYLEDGNGRPYGKAAPENKALIFRIYKHDTSTAGSELIWAERQTVTLDNGSFSVQLGSGVQEGTEPHGLLADAFKNNVASVRYLGITVNGAGGEIAPRLQFLTAPYAHLASQANKLINPVDGGEFNPFIGVALPTSISAAVQSTTSGGNARGANATDLQIIRSSNSQVASGDFSVVGGGERNTASGDHSVVSGGMANRATGQYSWVGGGLYSYADGWYSVVPGGLRNQIGTDSHYSTIGGGRSNNIPDMVVYATISGGDGNKIGSGLGDFATVSGGRENDARAAASTIGGGGKNVIETAASFATIAGGWDNTATGQFSVVGGGRLNRSIGDNSMVPGGLSCEAHGHYSFAAGRNAKATNVAAFVWADSNDFDFTSSANNEFSVRATGGVRLVSGIDGSGGITAGISLAAGASAWSTLSDRNRKKQFAPVDNETVLEKLDSVAVTSWRYEWENESTVKHIGPTAQDFKHAFYPGRDDKSITTLEVDGVALAAIKGLKARDDQKSGRINELEQENENLKQTLNELLRRVQALEAKKQ